MHRRELAIERGYMWLRCFPGKSSSHLALSRELSRSVCIPTIEECLTVLRALHVVLKFRCLETTAFCALTSVQAVFQGVVFSCRREGRGENREGEEEKWT